MKEGLVMKRYLSFGVTSLVIFALMFATHAQGDDPFGGASDPFGGAGGDPFGSNDDPNAENDPFGGGGAVEAAPFGDPDPFGGGDDPFGGGDPDPFGGGGGDPFGSGGGGDPFGGEVAPGDPFAPSPPRSPNPATPKRGAPGDPPGVKTFPKRAGEGSTKKTGHSNPGAVKVSDTPVEVAKAQENIRRKLMLPGDFVFVENAMRDVIKSIEKAYDIQIEIDTRALDGVGIGTDTPINLNLRNVSLKHAMRSMLRELELTMMISDEVVMITTPEEAESNLVTRIYPVGDLVDPKSFTTDFGSNRTLDELIDVIRSVIAPSSWDEVGGPGSLESVVTPSHCLVCSNTEDVHDRIAELLSDIRKLPKDNEPAVKEGEAVLRVYLLNKEPLEMEQIAAAVRKLVGEDGDNFVESAANHIIVKNTPEAHRKAKNFLEAFLDSNSHPFGVR